MTPSAAPLARRFHSGQGEHILVVPYSRIYDLPPSWLDDDGELLPSAHGMLEALAMPGQGEADLDLVPLPPVRSLSLNVSSSCNLACNYCYAGRGGFGGKQSGAMEWPVAKLAVDRLLDQAAPGERSTIGFLGGEPFVNARLIHQVVDYASARASRRGLWVQYAVTTNGTLLDAADLALLRAHPFSVTVSVDGGADVQRRQRPYHNGGGDSWSALRRAIDPLLAAPGLAQIAARATVQREDMDLPARFDAILAAGFPEVGFSPLRRSPSGDQGLGGADWQDYGRAIQVLARRQLDGALRGEPIQLTNFAVALRQLYRGWAAPYSCGAGGGYFSVAKDGDWYACHRAIGDPAFRMGDSGGLDQQARTIFLQRHHVHAQTDCNQCWARYLCSGGCHQEAPQRDAASCDFIRSWLEFCLAAYCDLSAAMPSWFAPVRRPEGARHATP